MALFVTPINLAVFIYSMDCSIILSTGNIYMPMGNSFVVYLLKKYEWKMGLESYS